VPELAKKYIRAIVKDKDGNLYIATSGTGIYKVNKTSGDSSIMQLTMLNGLLSNRITCLHYDKKGQLWYGTENGGVGTITNDIAGKISFTTKDGLPSNAVRCFTEDKRGYLWIGTAGNGIVSIPIYQGDYKVEQFARQN